MSQSFRLILLLAASGCSREAEIYDEPDAQVAPVDPRQVHEIPELPDAGLDAERFATCSERAEGACRGTNDFVCDFEDYAEQIIHQCFEQTACMAEGWVALQLDAEGCAKTIGMDEANDAFVECLVEILGQIRCPCPNSNYTHFLGVDNRGCPDDSGPLG